MNCDNDKIDDYTLAILYLVAWQERKGLGPRP